MRNRPCRLHCMDHSDLVFGTQARRGSPLRKEWRRVPCARTGLLSCCPEIPAWICAQVSHHDQVVNLQALPSEEAEPTLVLHCPARVLRIYLDRTRSFRNSEQLFFCYGSQQKGKAVSKQRLAHWIVDAITLVYKSQGEPSPWG